VPRIDTTIRALVAIGCLAIVLLYAWQSFAGWESVNREATRQEVNLAASLAQQTSSSFAMTDSVLQRMYFWANLHGVSPPVRDMLRQILSVRTSSMKLIGELAFVDAAGHAVVRSGPLPSPSTAATERRAFAYHATHPSLAPMVSTPPGASMAPASTITVSRRFNDRHGTFAGIVLATIAGSSLEPSYDAVDVGRHGVITLLLSDGEIVFRRPLGLVSEGIDNRTDSIAKLARVSMTGTVTRVSPLDGQNRMVTFHRVDGFPLIVVLGFAAADTFAAWRIASIAGGVGVGCILLTIVLLARALLAELARNARAQVQLANYASHDGLTGIFNRRAFDAAIAQEWQAGLRDGTRLALIMLDVDWFKGYNDRYGHQLGDEVLEQIAVCLREQCSRPRDVVARYGGEEFVALLPSTTLEGARHLAEGVRRDVVSRNISHAGSVLGVVTVSIGVAAMIPANILTPADLIRAADVLLYEAKRSGRNKVASREERPVLAREKAQSAE
jgi:diguanylate cyclase (GGDEF)-like protein